MNSTPAVRMLHGLTYVNQKSATEFRGNEMAVPQEKAVEPRRIRESAQAPAILDAYECREVDRNTSMQKTTEGDLMGGQRASLNPTGNHRILPVE